LSSESEQIQTWIKIREEVKRDFGCKGERYRKANQKIQNLRNANRHKSKGLEKFKRRLAPLLVVLLKLERDKMLQDEKKELARALRPYAVEAVVNDEHQIDFDALREITQEKINADRE